jgi:hypothetical protein
MSLALAPLFIKRDNLPPTSYNQPTRMTLTCFQ